MKNFAIVGGGIGGLTLAIAMQRKGMNVRVFESAPQFKPLGAGLALASNAMKALAEIGIADPVLKAGKQIRKMYGKDGRGRIIAFTDAELLTSRFGVVNNFTIHRADLHEVLLGQMRPSTLVYQKTCTDFQQSQDGVNISFADGTQERADYLVACDGIHSPIRRKLLPESVPRYAGYTCWRAVVDDLPEGLSMDETTESWGPGRRFGVVPLSHNRVYWFATLNAKANDPAMQACRAKDLQKIFKDFHFPVAALLKGTRDDQIIWSDIIDVRPIRQFAFDRVILTGDAAHATTPNIGQGACMAIEDAATLANGLAKYPPEEAFRKFETHRIARTTAIVNRSWSFGKVAQWENPAGRWLRDLAMRSIPQKTIDEQLKWLYDVSFEL